MYGGCGRRRSWAEPYGSMFNQARSLAVATVFADSVVIFRLFVYLGLASAPVLSVVVLL